MEIAVSEERPEYRNPGQTKWVLVDIEADTDDDFGVQFSDREYDYRPSADAMAHLANEILRRRPDLTPDELDRALDEEN